MDRDLVRLRTHVSYSLKGEKKVRTNMTWTMKGLLKVQNDKSFYQFKAMALVENGNGCANLIRREEIKKGYKLAFG